MRYISTTDTNITFTDTNGKVMVVPKNRVYTHFNVDTVTFLLIERYDNEGICIFTTIAEDLQINGTTYTYEQLLDGEGISDLFSPTGSLSYKIVDELPQTGTNGVIYLVPKGENSYAEYLWIEDEERYEMFGDVGDIDLTDYYTKTQVDEKLVLKANASEVYTKTEADNKFLTEHQSLDNYYTKDEVYNKTESDAKYATQVVVNEEIAARIQGDADINTALGTKADKSDTYTKTEVDTALALKQDASTAFSGDYNDLTNKPTIPTVPTNVSAFTNDAGYLTEHQSLSDYYTKSEVNTELANKQDKLTAGSNITIDANNVISATGGGGVEQIQSDWNQTDDTAVDFIKNKPTIPDTSDFATKTELNAKQDALISGTNIKTINNESILGEGNIEIQGGGGEQQQADWNQTDTTAVDYIKNKPTIPDTSDFVTKAEYNPKEVAIAEALTDLNENKADKTEIPDVSNYYTKTEIDAMVGNINTILASI